MIDGSVGRCTRSSGSATWPARRARPSDALVQETATALASFGSDPAGPGHRLPPHRVAPADLGPLVWFCARVLTAGDADDGDLGGGRGDAGRPHRRPSWPTPCRRTPASPCWAGPTRSARPCRAGATSRCWPIDTGGEASGFVSRLWRCRRRGHRRRPGPASARRWPSSTVRAARVAGDRSDEFLAVSGSRAAAAVARHAGRPGLAGRRRRPDAPAVGCGTACAAGSSPTSRGTPTTRSFRSTSSTAWSGPRGPESRRRGAAAHRLSRRSRAVQGRCVLQFARHAFST